MRNAKIVTVDRDFSIQQAMAVKAGRIAAVGRNDDILTVIDWLKANGHDEVHLVGSGWGAVPATFAALLSDIVVQVTLKNALTSYSDMAESDAYRWPLSTSFRGY